MASDFINVDWDGLVTREGPVVWRAVRRVVGNDADAQDVFQETFLAAVEVSQKQTVRQWRGMLLRLAHARAMDRLRTRYRGARRLEVGESEGEVAAVASPRPSPHEYAEAGELSERLRAALAELPEKQAEVFTLFCLEGWTYQEIGGHAGLSIDAVGVTVHRARARLRTLLLGDDQHVVRSQK